MYRPELDLDRIEAIDVHVHIEIGKDGHRSLPDDLVAALAKYFKADGPNPDLAGVAAYYRERRMAAVVFTVDSETALGHPPISSREIAEQAADHADVLIPFASVDPLQGARAIDLAQSLVADHGARGFKLHPTVQGFDPTDPALSAFWAALEQIGLPVIVHSGQTGVGAGLPGGHGFRTRLSNPMLLDDVLAEHPALQVVLAHPSVPWVDEQISVATHKGNAWIDLSGWSPKYFPAELVRYANSVLKRRVLFGTDYPLLTPDRWLRDVQATDLKPDVLPGILKDNAARLLGLAG